MAAATMRRKQRDTRIEGNHGDTELRTISSLLLQNRPLLGEQLGHFLSGWVQSWKHHAESWTSEAGHICPLFHRFSDHKTSIQLILTAIPPKSIIKCQKQWCLRCVCIYLSIYIYIFMNHFSIQTLYQRSPRSVFGQEYAIMAALRYVNRCWRKSHLCVGQEGGAGVQVEATQVIHRYT